MIKHLGLTADLLQGSVSGYELGTREPPLPILLKYARAAGVSTDVLIDDEVDLPQRLVRRARENAGGRGLSLDAQRKSK